MVNDFSQQANTSVVSQGAELFEIKNEKAIGDGKGLQGAFGMAKGKRPGCRY